MAKMRTREAGYQPPLHPVLGVAKRSARNRCRCARYTRRQDRAGTHKMVVPGMDSAGPTATCASASSAGQMWPARRCQAPDRVQPGLRVGRMHRVSLERHAGVAHGFDQPIPRDRSRRLRAVHFVHLDPPPPAPISRRGSVRDRSPCPMAEPVAGPWVGTLGLGFATSFPRPRRSRCCFALPCACSSLPRQPGPSRQSFCPQPSSLPGTPSAG